MKYVLALLAAAMLLGGVYLQGRRDERAAVQQEERAAAQRQLSAALADRDAREAAYVGRIRNLEESARNALRGQPIRLCKSSPSPDLPPATPGSDSEYTGGESVLQAGDDIRGELVSYAKQCEELRQKLLALN